MDDGSISQARNMVLAFGGSLTGATNVTVPDSIEKCTYLMIKQLTIQAQLLLKLLVEPDLQWMKAKDI